MSKIRLKESSPQFQDWFVQMYPELADHTKKLAIDGNKSALLTKNITFVVTEDCNLDCSYCYEAYKKKYSVMTKETAKKAIDTILNDEKMNNYINSKASPGVILEFIGGEPLLEIELISYICDYFRYKAFELNHPWYKYYMISITTNGTLYHTPKVQEFIKRNHNRLSMGITIDGDKELHDACRIFKESRLGSYDIVSKNIKLAIEQLAINSTKVTFSPENIGFISTSIPHLFDLGLTELHANCVFENVWKPEHSIILYKELIKLADYMIDNKVYEYGFCSILDSNIGRAIPSEDNKNWCGGNGEMLAIGTDGRMFPCIRFMSYSLTDQKLPEFEIGNVDKGIDSIKDNKFLVILNNIDRRSQSTNECYTCPVAEGCAWCTGYNYDEFKTPNKRATYICWTHKARVLASYYYFNKLYKITGDTMNYFEMNLAQKDIDYITEGRGLPNVE